MKKLYKIDKVKINKKTQLFLYKYKKNSWELINDYCNRDQ